MIPDTWKDSTTSLIFKKGDVDNINNWRPIAVGDTCPKLFAALLAERLKTWARVNGRFSPSQKGFLDYEGCFEHNLVLQQAIHRAKEDKRELVMVWLDFSSAFSSLPHSSITRALREHQVPCHLRNIIERLYIGSRTRIRTIDGLTDSINMEAGVKQGCPLSPDIFNLTLEVVLRHATSIGVGFKLDDEMLLSVLAYADDLVLLADSEEGMRRHLEATQEAARAIGLSFNPEKCASLHIGPDGVRNTRYSVQDVLIAALGPEDTYTHLGIPTGYQIHQTPCSTLAGMITDLRKIDESLLAPWQKLDAAGSFILPRLDFAMQGAETSREHLTEADGVVKKLAKKWMALPQRASPELAFVSPSTGGGGLLPLSNLYEAYTQAHVLRMLTQGTLDERSASKVTKGHRVSSHA